MQHRHMVRVVQVAGVRVQLMEVQGVVHFKRMEVPVVQVGQQMGLAVQQVEHLHLVRVVVGVVEGMQLPEGQVVLVVPLVVQVEGEQTVRLMVGQVV